MSPLYDLFGEVTADTVRPVTIAELAVSVQDAVAAGRAVVPVGGGTGQDYGYPLSSRNIALLDLSELNRIVAIEPGDLTITVEAGVTLSEIQSALFPHRLFLPLDPPHSERATIGGILATNAFGPSRLGYGTVRDYLIGLSVVDAEGRIVRGGGKVVKNVTGYDLPKLHIGALGTLGVIAEATFKVAPLPEATRTVIVTRGASAEDDRFLQRILETTAATQAYLRSDDTGRYIVFVYASFIEAVEQETERVRAAIQDRERLTVVPELLAREETAIPPLTLRLSGLPADDFARHEALTTLTQGSGATVETLLGCGISEGTWHEATEAAVSAARYVAETLVKPGGFATGYVFPHAPLSLRESSFPLWSPEPMALPLMRRLKDQLDPNHVLNPGRFIGRL